MKLKLKCGLKIASSFCLATLVAPLISQSFACPAEDQQIITFDINADIENTLPANFRTMQDVAKLNFQYQSDSLMQGLANINASGSAEFYAEAVQPLIRNLRKKGAHDITIVDLREESHAHINGVPYSWHLKPTDHLIYARYNLGKSAQEIEKDEAQKIADLKLKKVVQVFDLHETKQEKKQWPDLVDCTNQDNFVIETIMQEKDLVHQNGLHYVRLPITDDHGPTSNVIDDFIKYFKEHKNTWFHAHCQAGHGRTTTILSFIDMLYNAKNVPFEIIIKRQSLLGNTDMLAEKNTDSPAKEQAHKQRTETLKNFYQYCKENTDNYTTTYSEWLKNRKNT